MDMTDAELVEAIRDRRISVHTLEKVRVASPPPPLPRPPYASTLRRTALANAVGPALAVQTLGDCERAVAVRRLFVKTCLENEGRPVDGRAPFDDLPSGSFDYARFYSTIEGANCESVVGFLPVPVGMIGPLVLDGEPFRVPMATTEGALIASTNRGCRAITMAGGAYSTIVKNGMTRAPLLRVPSVRDAAALKQWVDQPLNKARLTEAFNSTTRFGKLQSVEAWIAGRNVYLRFACHCGDAMGMNMVTKGCARALEEVKAVFPQVEILAMSGNACADKKAAAINWVQGRGRSVVCEAFIPAEVVRSVLKTTPDAMIKVNINKNLVGSAVAGALGGFNAHAANIVAAVFLATGNDPAQVIESSQCMTLLEKDGEDLHVSVTMPSIEVGTIGGGTGLPAQAAALAMIGCQGANREVAGANADRLARVVAASVMAGELSLLAALATNDLLKAHIELNRKPAPASASNAHITTRAAHTDRNRPMHTQTHHYARFIGHPSAGGPMPHGQGIARALEEDLPNIYFFPGMTLQREAKPTRTLALTATVSEEDLYGEGPMLVVP
jgi:hydroxymethylglutaryl-CoA reductase (NADPH)